MTGDGELADLIATLHETHERIRALTGANVDAVLHQDGASYLLPQAQADLHQSEAALRRSAAERTAILDSLPAHIVVIDGNGVILTANQRWKTFADTQGYRGANHMIGQNYLAVCAATTGAGAGDAQQAHDGILSVLAGTRDTFRLEYPCHSPDQKRWFTLIAMPIAGADRDGAVLSHFDITERVLAEQRTREVQSRLKRIIDQATVGILVERQGRPLLANPELARILAYPSADAIMALDSSMVLVAEDEQDRMAGYAVDRLAGREAPGVYRVRGVRSTGAEIMLEARSFVIRWGDDDATCTMVNDITEQLENEEKVRQSQKMQAIGQLTGGLAHDFNNLLTIILGNSETLEDMEGATPQIRSIGRKTRRAAESGAELTSRLLAFARQQPLAPQTTDINRLIADMDDLLRRTLGAHIAIEIDHGAGLWQAFVDDQQLQNAVLNVCLNARDAMPEGGKLAIDLANIRLDPCDTDGHDDIEPGPYVLIAVSDTGTGMAPDILDRAIEPFFTTKGISENTGLGLSMVYGFVRQSNGHLKLSSEPGVGTTVKIYLPRAPIDMSVPDPPVSPKTELEANEANRDGPRIVETILVVEDNDGVRHHASAQLEKLGYRVIQASNGADALDLLNQGAPADMLFTDIVLPDGMNGRQLADAVRELRPRLPVLFTSGYSENALIHQGRLGKGVELLSKPYRRQELARKVRKVIESNR